MTHKVLAVIPAKGASRRLPGKNMQVVGGRPLLQWTLDAARESRLVTDVCVTTDSAEIRAYCEAQGAWVPYRLPSHLCGADVPPIEPVLDVLAKLGGAAAYTHCVMLLPTFPLRTAASIDAALALAISRNTSVVSVKPLPEPIQFLRTVSTDGILHPLEGVRVRRSASASGETTLFVLDGSICCAPVRSLLWARNFHHGQPVAYALDPEEALDIDTAEDLARAELRLARRHGAAVA